MFDPLSHAVKQQQLAVYELGDHVDRALGHLAYPYYQVAHGCVIFCISNIHRGTALGKLRNADYYLMDFDLCLKGTERDRNIGVAEIEGFLGC